MVDSIGNAAAAGAYASTAKITGGAGGQAAAQTGFGDFLQTAIEGSIQTMKAGETAAGRAVAGEATLPQVVGAVNAADLTLNTVIAVRDRMISAYQEIMRMPI